MNKPTKNRKRPRNRVGSGKLVRRKRRTDKQRLEWLLAKATPPDWVRDWPQCWKLDVWLNVSNHDDKQPSVREAIDAEMDHEMSSHNIAGQTRPAELLKP